MLKLIFSVWLSLSATDEERPLFRAGTIRVLPSRHERGPYHYLMQFDTHRGLNYLRPDNPGDVGNREKDFSRLATCYHHAKSPVGQVLKRFNWFAGPENTYWADVRMPASLVALGATPLGVANLPAAQLVGLWSEPPVGVIGMYVGTIASYARPFQHIDFYEKNAGIIALSLPAAPGERPYFGYIADAQKRGALVKVCQGDERPTLAHTGPSGFYHALVLEICTRDRLEDISANLLTMEGMALCFEKLVPRGWLCIHTSNRYINTVPVIADVAAKLGFSCKLGRDKVGTMNGDYARFSCEWIIVAKKAATLQNLGLGNQDIDWSIPVASGKYIWSDLGRNSYRGLYRADPSVSRLRLKMNRLAHALVQAAQRLGVNRSKVQWCLQHSRILIDAVTEPLNRAGMHVRETSAAARD